MELSCSIVRPLSPLIPECKKGKKFAPASHETDALHEQDNNSGVIGQFLVNTRILRVLLNLKSNFYDDPVQL